MIYHEADIIIAELNREGFFRSTVLAASQVPQTFQRAKDLELGNAVQLRTQRHAQG